MTEVLPMTGVLLESWREKALARAEEKLEGVIASFTGGPGGPDFAAGAELLAETAAALEGFAGTITGPSDTGESSQVAAPLVAERLRALMLRLDRLRLLLDGAAAFYRGWFSALPPDSASYQPAGSWAESPAQGTAGRGLAGGCLIEMEA